MATHSNPKAARGGHRSSATKLIAAAKTELDKGEGGSLVVMGVLLNKLTEKLSKIRVLDEIIVEAMDDGEEIQAETLAQDDKAVEIGLVIADLNAAVKGHLHEAENEQENKKVQSFTKLPKLELRWFSGNPLMSIQHLSNNLMPQLADQIWQM